VTFILAVILATCSVDARIILSAPEQNHNVFLWHDRAALQRFAAGKWTSTTSVMASTTLLPPGTKAIVDQCADAHSLVGIKLTSGPHRGMYGWVRLSDTH
jgi:hypothetical protein